MITSEHLEALKVNYMELKKQPKNALPLLHLSTDRLMSDLASLGGAPAKKVEDEYDEDFEEDEKAKAKQKGSPSATAPGSSSQPVNPATKKKEPGKYMDEEEMLDVAEHCFIRMAEALIERGRTARAVFSKFAVPEQFPDGTVLELLSPIGFLEGVKEAAGAEELSEMEAACLLRVLAKPELDNAIILNEFTMIMENFGVPDGEAPAAEEEDDDDFDDYMKDEDYEESPRGSGKFGRAKPRRRKILLNFDELEEKAHKILRKLARFLLERYMHPREFYGPSIYRQMLKLKCNGESHPVDILHARDFYSRMKAAGVRRTAQEVEALTRFLRLDAKFPHLMQMKKVVKALEEVA